MAYADAMMEWIDGNLGSQLTMKYPAVYMMEPGARGEILSIAFAGKGQHQDAGGRSSTARRTPARGSSPRRSARTAAGPAIVACSRFTGARRGQGERRLRRPASWTRQSAPTPIRTSRSTRTVKIGHEASVSKIGEEQLFYLHEPRPFRGRASTLIVNGFIEPLVKELPMEYAVEMNRLIQLQMEGSVG